MLTERWGLPREAEIGGKIYPIHTDFRDILEIIGYLNDENDPEFIRWQIALALFYEGDIPPSDQREAMEFLGDFIACGEQGKSRRLLDWEQDAPLIAADVNRVAGQEIRALPYLHWWTFLGWFHSIGEGRLSTVVSLRRKLQSGQPLEKWEQGFYRENRALVDLKKHYTAEELAQQERLNKLLG